MSKQPKDLTNLKAVNKQSDDYTVGYLNGFTDGEKKGKSEGYYIGRKIGIEIAMKRYKELDSTYEARRVKK